DVWTSRGLDSRVPRLSYARTSAVFGLSLTKASTAAGSGFGGLLKDSVGFWLPIGFSLLGLLLGYEQSLQFFDQRSYLLCGYTPGGVPGYALPCRQGFVVSDAEVQHRGEQRNPDLGERFSGARAQGCLRHHPGKEEH